MAHDARVVEYLVRQTAIGVKADVLARGEPKADELEKMLVGRPSPLSYIETGLEKLRAVIFDGEIKSVAVPALGCGYGGWTGRWFVPILSSA